MLKVNRNDKLIAIKDSVGKYNIGKGYKVGDIFTVDYQCGGSESDHFCPKERVNVAFYLPHFELVKV